MGAPSGLVPKGTFDNGFENGITENTVVKLSPKEIGEKGEKALAEMVGGESQQYFKTNYGGRYVDQLADNIAHESKVGFTTLSNRITRQIMKDKWLVDNGRIEESFWHFFESDVTHKIGPSKKLRQLLIDNNITIIEHTK